MNRQKRAEKCWQEIQKLLVKHNCVLVAQPSFTQEGRVVANITIMARGEDNDTGS
jgi:hypothetical protein